MKKNKIEKSNSPIILVSFRFSIIISKVFIHSMQCYTYNDIDRVGVSLELTISIQLGLWVFVLYATLIRLSQVCKAINMSCAEFV